MSRSKMYDDRYYKLVSLWDPVSPQAEAYRRIRTNIQSVVNDDGKAVVLVTSALSKEGKTTACANLAIVMAQAGLKTCYVDTDIRKPAGHLAFHLNNEIGLTAYLTGSSAIDDIIQPTIVPQLFAITRGQSLQYYAELLSSNYMGKLLRELRERFDVILLDCAPILSVADPLVLAKQVDGCVLVIDSQHTKRESALKAKRQLEHVDAVIVGVILNNSKMGKNQYSYS